MNLCFLDIDGVIATQNTHFLWFDEACLSQLKVLVEIEDLWIVVTSTWRKRYSIAGIRHLFACQGDKYGCIVCGRDSGFPVDRIIGLTPDFVSSREEQKAKGEVWGRGSEIQWWLKYASENAIINKILVLDDDVADIEPFCKYQIKTDALKGMHSTDVVLARKLLAEQSNWSKGDKAEIAGCKD